MTEGNQERIPAMLVPPEIKFHDVDRSQWVEDYIVERLGHLERMGNGMTSAHVTLTQEQRHHHKGNLYSLLVEVRLPPHHDLAAKKEKTIGKMHAELPALINEAFGAIEKQVKKTAALRRGHD
jgi:ribosome-associated translation inhibitor RaiA